MRNGIGHRHRAGATQSTHREPLMVREFDGEMMGEQAGILEIRCPDPALVHDPEDRAGFLGADAADLETELMLGGVSFQVLPALDLNDVARGEIVARRVELHGDVGRVSARLMASSSVGFLQQVRRTVPSFSSLLLFRSKMPRSATVGSRSPSISSISSRLLTPNSARTSSIWGSSTLRGPLEPPSSSRFSRKQGASAINRVGRRGLWRAGRSAPTPSNSMPRRR